MSTHHTISNVLSVITMQAILHPASTQVLLLHSTPTPYIVHQERPNPYVLTAPPWGSLSSASLLCQCHHVSLHCEDVGVLQQERLELLADALRLLHLGG